MNRFTRCVFASALLLATGLPAAAQTAITHDKALSGGITPGDAPGYPITLSRGGSYILESNLEPPTGTNGIEIRDFDVAVDFNGFRLHGRNAALFGVHSTFNTGAIRNGVIADFRRTAVYAPGQAFWVVEGMTILVNGNQGVWLGESGLVLNSVISNNGGYGIIMSSGTVLGNTVANHGLEGILKVGASGVLGFGNNTLLGNDYVGGGQQVDGGTPLHGNACTPAC